jgi:eukaryotic-like serine/threonine-protein kinase
VHAVRLADGAAAWAYATEDIVEAPPMVHDGTVYAGSSDGYLYALDAKSGELRWRFAAQDRFVGAAVAVRGPEGTTHIVVGNYDTNLYCLDPADGKELWRYGTDNYVNGTPAIDERGRIVFGGCDAILHVVSATSGEALSRFELGETCNVAGSVALDEGRAYFGHHNNAFVCIDLEKQALVWQVTDPDHPFYSSAAVTGDVVVFGGQDKKLHCVDKATGAERWVFKTRRKVDGSPVVCGQRVVFGGGDGWLYVLDLATGAEVWSWEIGSAILTSPAVVGGEILIGANDAKLYCFTPDDGKGAGGDE